MEGKKFWKMAVKTTLTTGTRNTLLIPAFRVRKTRHLLMPESPSFKSKKTYRKIIGRNIEELQRRRHAAGSSSRGEHFTDRNVNTESEWRPAKRRTKFLKHVRSRLYLALWSKIVQSLPPYMAKRRAV